MSLEQDIQSYFDWLASIEQGPLGFPSTYSLDREPSSTVKGSRVPTRVTTPADLRPIERALKALPRAYCRLMELHYSSGSTETVKALSVNCSRETFRQGVKQAHAWVEGFLEGTRSRRS